MVILYKKLPTPLEEPEPKNHLIPQGPQQHQRGPPCDKNQISKEPQRIYPTLRRVGDAHQLPL
jgi:hypothetical protein